jgi:hypothetical protein
MLPTRHLSRTLARMSSRFHVPGLSRKPGRVGDVKNEKVIGVPEKTDPLIDSDMLSDTNPGELTFEEGALFILRRLIGLTFYA